MLARTPIVVALIGAAAIAAQAQRGRFDVQDVGLSALNVGLVMDTSRAPDSPASRAKAVVRAAIRDDARLDTAQTVASGRIIVRFRDDAPPAARAAAVRSVARSRHDRHATLVCRLRPRADRCGRRSGGGRGGAQGAACRRGGERTGCVSLADDAEAQRSAVRHEAVEPPVCEHRAGMGRSTVRGLRYHGRSNRQRCRVSERHHHREYPGVLGGGLDLPRAEQRLDSLRRGRSARQRVDAEPVRGAVRLHLGRRDAARLRGTWDPRRRHRRPAHERQHRARRGGVQRQADAGQGDRRRVGLPAGLAELRHRRSRRARNPLRGGSRREGSQHEHRTIGSAVVRRRGRHPLCRRPWRLRGGRRRERVPGGQSAVGACGDLFAGQRRGFGRGHRSQQGARLLFLVGPVCRDLRAGRRRQHARFLRHRQLHRAADARLPLHGNVSAAPVAVWAAAVRRHGLHRLCGDVDGDAARGRAPRRS